MIYFMQAAESGRVKIGWSKRPAVRLDTLSSNDPHDLSFVRLLDAPRWVEGWLHKRYQENRLHGEWFTFVPEMLTVEPPGARPGGKKPPVSSRFGDYTTIHVRLPREDLMALTRIAKLTERTISGVLRLAIRQWLEGFRASEGGTE